MLLSARFWERLKTILDQKRCNVRLIINVVTMMKIRVREINETLKQSPTSFKYDVTHFIKNGLHFNNQITDYQTDKII